MGVGAVRTSEGRRAPVLKGDLAALPMPRQPPKSASSRDACSNRNICDPPAVFANAADEQDSTLWGEARIPAYGTRSAGRPSKLAAYLDFLRERVTAFPDLSATRLTREIRELGYVGAYTAVTQPIGQQNS
jgi:hypothetical protein